MRCEWCGDVFDRPNRKGPAPRFCCQAHRQRAFEDRRMLAAQVATLTAERDAAWKEVETVATNFATLDAENTRLREALQHIYDHTNRYENEWHVARAALVPQAREVTPDEQ